MAPARGSAAKPRQAAQPAAIAQRGVGTRLRRRYREPQAVYGSATTQARTRSRQATLAVDRARDGLPVSAGPGRGLRRLVTARASRLAAGLPHLAWLSGRRPVPFW